MSIPQWRISLLGLVFVSRIFAAPICATTTLDVYLLLPSSGCAINPSAPQETVNTFTFTDSTTGGITALSPTAILVTPSFTSSKFQLLFTTMNTGFSGTSFFVPAGASATYEIDFNWDPVVVGAQDDMFASTPSPPGTATVTTDLCAGTIFGGVNCPGPSFAPTNTVKVFNDGMPSDAIPTATTFFTSPALIIGTRSVIQLNSNGTGTSEITGFDTAVFTPEPGSLFLMLAGLLGLSWRLRGWRQPAL